jgi:phytoene dehydrogenase-like protein
MSTVVIGSGHNALVAAYYLAKAGRKPIVLERRPEVGGGAITGEIAPGFRCPTLTHEVLLHADVVSELDLARHGLELLTSAAEVCALDPYGPPVVLYEDPHRTAESLARAGMSGADVARIAAFRGSIARAATVIAPLLSAPAPGLDRLQAGDVWRLLTAGRAFRALGPREARQLLRWLPMPIADLAAEWCDHELLRATFAATGLVGTMLGPRSAGSTLVMLLREAHVQLAGRRPLRPRGGPGAVTRALAAAAQAAGAEIRTRTRAERILVDNGRAVGVVANGQEIPAQTVVCGADPRTTFLDLIEPGTLDPDFSQRVRNYRAHGTLAKLNHALSALPSVRDVASDPGALSGRIHIGPTLEYLERAFDRAKYGELPKDPWLDVSIPSILDPALAPRGAHVASVYVHYAPYRLVDNTWDRAAVTLERSALDVLERYAPGIRQQLVASELITPQRLESEFGFAGGQVFHGELAPDQLFSFRPQLGYERYATPVQGLFLCGAGTHPGGFLTGASGRLAAREVLREARI